MMAAAGQDKTAVVLTNQGERVYWLFVADLALLTWVGQKELAVKTLLQTNNGMPCSNK